MSYYTIKQINPWLYSIYDPMDVYCYLLVGEESALLYDTGYGIAPLEEAIRQVCNLPLIVVLGHGHIDHANGAYQFNEAWIHLDDLELCLRHTSRTARRNIVGDMDNSKPECFNDEQYINAGSGNLKHLTIGQIFDLGNLHVEIVAMEGHTAGSVGLLVHEHQVLIDSDAASPHVWMFLNEILPMNVYIDMLERVSQMNFDTFFIGHSDTPRPKSDFKKYINVARNITLEKSTPYDSMSELGGLLYQEGDAAIVFNPEKLP